MSTRRSRKIREPVELKEVGEGVWMGAIANLSVLTHALARHVDPRAALVLRLPAEVAVGALMHEALTAWAQACDVTPALALVMPTQCVPAMRGVAMDMASDGVLVGVFSEGHMPFAIEHAARERQLIRADHIRKFAAEHGEPIRPSPGVNVFIESLSGRRIAGEPDPGLDDLDADELNEARALVDRFTLSGRVRQAMRPVDFNDPYAVATLELRGRVETHPGALPVLGAWLHRMKERGAGHCTPLHGTAEGLHVLVLDAQAVFEMKKQVAQHEESVAIYEKLQADLAQLRQQRGGCTDRGAAG